MKLLEQYEELVERSASEMSYAWKGSLIVAHFLNAVSSYTCAIIFYTFWHDVCGGHCLFWAEVELQPKTSFQNVSSLQATENNVSYDWTQDIFVVYYSHKYCNWFLFACLLSCIFAITFLMMFCICGKGGYDTSLFVAPWRIVIPAQVASLCMMLVTMTAAHEFTHGYHYFTKNLYQVAHRVMKTTKNPFKYTLPCEALQAFMNTHNIYHFNSCGIYTMIQISSWTMTWSWIGSFFILCLRILTSADFSLLKIKIYEIPKEESEKKAILEKARYVLAEDAALKAKIL